MTKTLTEQWRDGTLPEDCYYILTKNGHIKKDRTCFYSHTEEQCFCFTPNKDIEEVLAPVPSYDEFLALSYFKIIDEDAIQKLIKENNRELIKKTDKLEKQLEIATKALKDMPEMSRAQRALREMEGVK